MTKFINGFNTPKKEKKKKKTVFKSILKAPAAGGMITDIFTTPARFDNVVFIGHDKYYGDVFIAYQNGNEDEFTLFFGTKGDEFDNE